MRLYLFPACMSVIVLSKEQIYISYLGKLVPLIKTTLSVLLLDTHDCGLDLCSRIVLERLGQLYAPTRLSREIQIIKILRRRINLLPIRSVNVWGRSATR